MVDAETLAAWNRDNGPSLSTAERAGADRSWAYGHVIIDEAQELSAMAWRMVLRRNPARSMTVVGDVAQTGSPAGARSWKAMLNPLVGGRWREERLTVNYRTPAEIMTVAADVLASVAPAERPPESVRSEGVEPRAIRSPAGADFAAGVAQAARADLAELGGPDGGRLAVIAPDALRRRGRGGDPRGGHRRPPRVPRRGGHPAHRVARPRALSSTAWSWPTRPASSPSPPTAATTSTWPSPAPPTASPSSTRAPSPPRSPPYPRP